MAINLLAEDLAPKANIVRFANSLKTFSIIGLGIFVVGTAGMIGLFVINSARIDASGKRQQVLKDSIAARAQTEQRLFLLKNRLAHFKVIQETTDVLVQLGHVSQTQSKLPPGSHLALASIDDGKIELTLVADSSTALSQGLRSVMENASHATVRLDSYSVKPGNYQATFTLLQ